MGQSYAIKMQSEIPGWAGSVENAPHGLLDEISWSGPAAMEAPR
jgi:hypothetical protein